ncbi:MAG: PAAR/RHS domain-containing protein [Rhodocyclales bacterium]|nr:PAAR/RHS domain-containing protein [Rhodocyclales bacterium]
MTLQPAARLNDPIAHTPLLAQIGKTFSGLVVGALVGAAVAAATAAALTAAGVITASTGGLGVIVAVTLVSSVLMQVSGAGQLIEGATNVVNNAIDALLPPERCGFIAQGSPNVFINMLPAARAVAEGDDNQAICKKHPPYPPQYLAEGSATVFTNDHPAHRVKDRTTCDARTDKGSPNVFIGGQALQTREIAPEMSPILSAVGAAAGVALALCTRRWKDIPGKLACLGLTMGIGLGAETAVAAAFGNPVHAATGAKLLDGAHDTDFALPSLLPLAWTRRYNSLDTRDGLLGPGWSLPVSVELKLDPDGEHPHLYIDEQGREIPFDALAPGESLLNTAEGYRLGLTESGRYIIEDQDGILREFAPARGEHPRVLALAAIEDYNGNAIRLQRDADARLIGLSDAAGRHYRCHYDPDHPRRLAAVELLPAHDEPHPTTADSPVDTPPAPGADILVRYAYDRHARLTAVTDRIGHTPRRFTWHDSGPGAQLLASHTLPDGLTTHYEWAAYPDHPRVVTQRSDDGNHWQADYDLSGGRTVVTDQGGRRRSWEWNTRHAITAHTDALGQRWAFEWLPSGLMASALQPNGGCWRFDYDTQGNLARQTDPLGQLTTLEWRTDRPQPIRHTDALGTQTRYDYDARGNLVRETGPHGDTCWTLDARGLPLARLDARGGRSQWTWNAAGQLTAHTDCSGHTTRYGYDADGRLTERIDALGQRTRYEHDPLGRLVLARLADDTTRRWEWTGAGRVAAAYDGFDRPTRYEYDPRGQLQQRTDAAARAVEFIHDRAGNLTALYNQNDEAYRFEYDAADRQSARIHLDGRRTEFVLDALGLPIEVREAAGTPDEILTVLKRDALGRLIERTTPESHTTYARDPLGRLTTIERRTAPGERGERGELIDRITFELDAAGNLLAETLEATLDARPHRHRLTHAYDALGNRIATTLPDGRTLNALHYGSGHLHQLNVDGQLVCDFERDALHRETHRSQGRLMCATRHDPLGRRLAQTGIPAHDHDHGHPHPHPDWNALETGPLSKRYAYDANGELIARADPLAGRLRRRLDPTGRVLATEVERPGTGARAQPAPHYGTQFDELFAYDAAANLVDTDLNGQARGRARFNRVTVFEDKRYTYDAHGRLATKHSGRHTRQDFTWNREHQLVRSSARRNGTEEHARYQYDALGRRIAKHDTCGLTTFVWDGMRLLQEQRARRTVTFIYQPDSHEPVARLDTDDDATRQHAPTEARIYYFHNHINGAPEELTDANGRIVWQGRYATWGNLALQTHAPGLEPTRHGEHLTQPLRLQGQYADAESGLHYNTFRYYDPDIGRFISEDPIGLAGGINLYEFAPNVDSWVDPWGWSSRGCNGAGGALGRGRSGALNEAKRDLGIPRFQHPENVARVPLTDRNGKAILGADGKPIMTREYTYTMPDGGKVVVQDHSAGHKFGEGGVGDQGSHFNVRPPENTRTGSVPGAQDHYNW